MNAGHLSPLFFLVTAHQLPEAVPVLALVWLGQRRQRHASGVADRLAAGTPFPSWRLSAAKGYNSPHRDHLPERPEPATTAAASASASS